MYFYLFYHVFYPTGRLVALTSKYRSLEVPMMDSDSKPEQEKITSEQFCPSSAISKPSKPDCKFWMQFTLPGRLRHWLPPRAGPQAGPIVLGPTQYVGTNSSMRSLHPKCINADRLRPYTKLKSPSISPVRAFSQCQSSARGGYPPPGFRGPQNF